MPEAGTSRPCASTGNVAGRVQRAEHFDLPRRAWLHPVILLFLAGAATFPAAGQGLVTTQLLSGTATNLMPSALSLLPSAILSNGLWFNPAFFPPVTVPVLSAADAAAAALALFQATNQTTVAPPFFGNRRSTPPSPSPTKRFGLKEIRPSPTLGRPKSYFPII